MHPTTLEQALAEVATLREELARVRACAACRAASGGRGDLVGPPARLAPEILSHCSDVSGSTKGTSTTITNGDRPSSLPASRKGQTGVRKPGKPRKDRAAPAPKPPGQSRYWTPEEHKLFLEALNRFGHKDLRAISAYVGTRNMTQVRTHSQKYFMRLMREAKRQNPLDTPAQPAQSPQPTSAPEAPAQTSASMTAAAPAPPPAPPPPPPPCEEVVVDAPSPVSTCVPAEKSDHTSSVQENPTTLSASGGEDTVMKTGDSDKYSVPNTCGMTLLCLVGQDTLTT